MMTTMRTTQTIKVVTIKRTATSPMRCDGRAGTRQMVIRRGLFDKMKGDADESSSSSTSATTTTSGMDRERMQNERLREMARTETSMRGNRYVERESGAKRGERAVLGFWQTFADVASEARRKHWSTGRKTVDGTSSKRQGK